MTTGVLGNQARLLDWQLVHYVAKGGPNDPEAQSNAPAATGPTSGGVLSWNSTIVRLPLNTGPAIDVPAGIQPPRPQTLLSAGTIGATVSNNTGGIHIGTLPMGAWIRSIECELYTAWTTGGTLNGFGVFYCQAGSFSNANAPGYQPATVYALASQATAGAAGTLYSTESGLTRTAWGNVAGNLGPGNANSGTPSGNLASLFDVDIYAIVFATAALTAGSMTVRVKYTGLEG